jgi:anti-anti-sigma factor
MAQGPEGPDVPGADDPGTPIAEWDVETTERDGAVIVALVGELDMTTVDSASAALRAATARGTRVVLDMTGLRFFSSAGLTLLVQLRRAASDQQVDVRLAGDQRAVALPLELTGLKDLFPMYTSVDQALAAPTDQDTR